MEVSAALFSLTSVFAMSRKERVEVKKLLKFEGSLTEVSKKNCQKLEKKQIYTETVFKKLEDIMNQFLHNSSKKSIRISDDIKVKIKKNADNVYKNCSFLQIKSDHGPCCGGLTENEKKYASLRLIISIKVNRKKREKLEIEGLIAHFIKRHHFFGNVTASQLIRFLNIKAVKNYKLEIDFTKLLKDHKLEMSLTESESERLLGQSNKPVKPVESASSRSELSSITLSETENSRPIRKPVTNTMLTTSVISNKPIFKENPRTSTTASITSSASNPRIESKVSSSETRSEEGDHGDECGCSFLGMT